MTGHKSLNVGKTPTPTRIYNVCIRSQEEISGGIFLSCLKLSVVVVLWHIRENTNLLIISTQPDNVKNKTTVLSDALTSVKIIGLNQPKMVQCIKA